MVFVLLLGKEFELSGMSGDVRFVDDSGGFALAMFNRRD